MHVKMPLLYWNFCMEINHGEDILLRNPINIEMNKDIISLTYLIAIELLR